MTHSVATAMILAGGLLVACADDSEPTAGSPAGSGRSSTPQPTRDAGDPPSTAGRPAGSEPTDSALDGDSGGGTGASPDAASPDAATARDDRCAAARLDPQHPPSVLSLLGDLGAHDPALIEADGVFYLWQTGPRLPAKRSSDLHSWQSADNAFGDTNPAWIASEIPGVNDLWAPDISYFNGLYHLYYSASTFGSNSSCIGHATRSRLDSGGFRDHGSVVCSNHGTNDNWNAIDPNAVLDAEGNAYLVFGSWWSGIKAIELDATGTRKNDQLHSLAARGGAGIEAPFIVRRCGHYYLFVSFDRCCNGASSTYNIRVGRSDKVLGPYVDKDGVAMLDGGGTLLVEGGGDYRGPGHNAVIFSGDRAYNAYHAYRADDGAPELRVAALAFDADGWPVSGGP